ELRSCSDTEATVYASYSPRHDAQVVDEPRKELVAVLAAEHRARVDRGHDELREVGVERPAAALRDSERPAEEALGSGRAEEHERFRLDGCELGLEPRAAGDLLRPRGLVVEAARPAGPPFEVLDGVRDVRRAAVDAGLVECAVEHLAGGADERLAGQVLLVAGLLADEHDLRARRARAEHGLRCLREERAALALLDGFAQLRKRAFLGQERLCGRVRVARGHGVGGTRARRYDARAAPWPSG